MTDTVFTASNGVEFCVADYSKIQWRTKTWPDWRHLGENVEGETRGLSRGSLIEEALREFFRHEEDERLQRWRSKLFPEYIVMPAGRPYPDEAIIVRSEREPIQHVYFSRPPGSIHLSRLAGVAAEYFAAHPPRKPILLQAQEDGTDEWFTIRTYPGDPGDRAHADASAHLLESQDVPARVIEGEAA